MRSTTERGYGAAHQAERQKWVPKVKAGKVKCYRCKEPIAPDQPWDLGHTDDRKAWTGPECVPCNRGAGGRNSARVQRESREMVIRTWFE